MKNNVLKKKLKCKTKILECENKDKIYVAIDVHKKTYHIAVRKNEQEKTHWSMPHDDNAIVKMFAKAKKNICKIVYEAGPTGYALARLLLKNNFSVGVVAPGKTPRPVNDNNKSDKLDCKMLAEFAEKDLLKYVAVPTLKQDAQRSVLRRLDKVTNKLAQMKTQIKSFLLYNSIAEPDGLQAWSKKSVEALHELELNVNSRFTLDSMLEELGFFKFSKERIIKQLACIRSEQEEENEILRTHPGVGELTAHYFLAEIFAPHRFSHKDKVAAYVGLAPRVSRSGEGCKEGGRIPSGRQKLRNTLIEASWQWIKLDPSARAIYDRLVRNSGNAKIAITAMARRMLINMWMMLKSKEQYRPPLLRATLCNKT